MKTLSYHQQGDVCIVKSANALLFSAQFAQQPRAMRHFWGAFVVLLLSVVSTSASSYESGSLASQDAAARAALRIAQMRELPRCSFSGHEGHLTLEEMIIKNATQECGRKPTVDDRAKYWVELRTGEMSPKDVRDSIMADCEGRGDTFSLGPWEKRMPGRVYAWSADFHPAPPRW